MPHAVAISPFLACRPPSPSSGGFGGPGGSGLRMGHPIDLQAYPLLGSLEDGRQLEVSKEMRSAIWCLLPEYVLERVVVFLPATSICRLRLVCKRWRCLLSSGRFFQEKATVAPLAPLICTLGHVELRHQEGPPQHCLPVTPPKPYRWDLSFITKEFLDSVPPEDGRRDRSVWALDERVDCVDGLLCISRKRRRGLPEARNLVVVNPVTRTYRLLPTVPSEFFSWVVTSARLELDEPFGTEFTLTWHMQEQDSRKIIWVVGKFSSQSNTWKICEEMMDRSWDWEDSEVCSSYFINLVDSGGNSYKCALHSYCYETGKFMKTGEVVIPRVVGQEKNWGLLHHGGDIYLIAVVLMYVGRTAHHSLEIWKLDLCSLKCVLVSTAPKVLIEQLLAGPLSHLKQPLILAAMSSVGDYICLRLQTKSEVGRNVHKSGELWHVLAFNLPQQCWHLLYEESEDEDRLIPLRKGQSYKNRTALPTYPFMAPNFHVFL